MFSNGYAQSGCEVAPQIDDTGLPKPVTLQLDAQAAITVRIAGYPPPSVKWQIGRKRVKESAKYHIETDGDQTHTLNISRVTTELEQGVWVVATNWHGEDCCLVEVRTFEIVHKQKRLKKKPKSLRRSISLASQRTGSSWRSNSSIIHVDASQSISSLKEWKAEMAIRNMMRSVDDLAFTSDKASLMSGHGYSLSVNLNDSDDPDLYEKYHKLTRRSRRPPPVVTKLFFPEVDLEARRVIYDSGVFPATLKEEHDDLPDCNRRFESNRLQKFEKANIQDESDTSEEPEIVQDDAKVNDDKIERQTTRKKKKKKVDNSPVRRSKSSLDVDRSTRLTSKTPKFNIVCPENLRRSQSVSSPVNPPKDEVWELFGENLSHLCQKIFDKFPQVETKQVSSSDVEVKIVYKFPQVEKNDTASCSDFEEPNKTENICEDIHVSVVPDKGSSQLKSRSRSQKNTRNPQGKLSVVSAESENPKSKRRRKTNPEFHSSSQDDSQTMSSLLVKSVDDIRLDLVIKSQVEPTEEARGSKKTAKKRHSDSKLQEQLETNESALSMPVEPVKVKTKRRSKSRSKSKTELGLASMDLAVSGSHTSEIEDGSGLAVADNNTADPGLSKRIETNDERLANLHAEMQENKANKKTKIGKKSKTNGAPNPEEMLENERHDHESISKNDISAGVYHDRLSADADFESVKETTSSRSNMATNVNCGNVDQQSAPSGSGKQKKKLTKNGKSDRRIVRARSYNELKNKKSEEVSEDNEVVEMDCEPSGGRKFQLKKKERHDHESIPINKISADFSHDRLSAAADFESMKETTNSRSNMATNLNSGNVDPQSAPSESGKKKKKLSKKGKSDRRIARTRSCDELKPKEPEVISENDENIEMNFEPRGGRNLKLRKKYQQDHEGISISNTAVSACNDRFSDTEKPAAHFESVKTTTGAHSNMASTLDSGNMDQQPVSSKKNKKQTKKGKSDRSIVRARSYNELKSKKSESVSEDNEIVEMDCEPSGGRRFELQKKERHDHEGIPINNISAGVARDRLSAAADFESAKEITSNRSNMATTLDCDNMDQQSTPSESGKKKKKLTKKGKSGRKIARTRSCDELKPKEPEVVSEDDEIIKMNCEPKGGRKFELQKKKRHDHETIQINNISAGFSHDGLSAAADFESAKETASSRSNMATSLAIGNVDQQPASESDKKKKKHTKKKKSERKIVRTRSYTELKSKQSEEVSEDSKIVELDREPSVGRSLELQEKDRQGQESISISNAAVSTSGGRLSSAADFESAKELTSSRSKVVTNLESVPSVSNNKKKKQTKKVKSNRKIARARSYGELKTKKSEVVSEDDEISEIDREPRLSRNLELTKKNRQDHESISTGNTAVGAYNDRLSETEKPITDFESGKETTSTQSNIATNLDSGNMDQQPELSVSGKKKKKQAKKAKSDRKLARTRSWDQLKSKEPEVVSENDEIFDMDREPRRGRYFPKIDKETPQEDETHFDINGDDDHLAQQKLQENQKKEETQAVGSHVPIKKPKKTKSTKSPTKIRKSDESKAVEATPENCTSSEERTRILATGTARNLVVNQNEADKNQQEQLFSKIYNSSSVSVLDSNVDSDVDDSSGVVVENADKGMTRRYAGKIVEDDNEQKMMKDEDSIKKVETFAGSKNKKQSSAGSKDDKHAAVTDIGSRKPDDRKGIKSSVAEKSDKTEKPKVPKKKGVIRKAETFSGSKDDHGSLPVTDIQSHESENINRTKQAVVENTDKEDKLNVRKEQEVKSKVETVADSKDGTRSLPVIEILSYESENINRAKQTIIENFNEEDKPKLRNEQDANKKADTFVYSRDDTRSLPVIEILSYESENRPRFRSAKAENTIRDDTHKVPKEQDARKKLETLTDYKDDERTVKSVSQESEYRNQTKLETTIGSDFSLPKSPVSMDLSVSDAESGNLGAALLKTDQKEDTVVLQEKETRILKALAEQIMLGNVEIVIKNNDNKSPANSALNGFFDVLDSSNQAVEKNVTVAARNENELKFIDCDEDLNKSVETDQVTVEDESSSTVAKSSVHTNANVHGNEIIHEVAKKMPLRSPGQTTQEAATNLQQTSVLQSISKSNSKSETVQNDQSAITKLNGGDIGHDVVSGIPKVQDLHVFKRRDIASNKNNNNNNQEVGLGEHRSPTKLNRIFGNVSEIKGDLGEYASDEAWPEVPTTREILAGMKRGHEVEQIPPVAGLSITQETVSSINSIKVGQKVAKSPSFGTSTGQEKVVSINKISHGQEVAVSEQKKSNVPNKPEKVFGIGGTNRGQEVSIGEQHSRILQSKQETENILNKIEHDQKVTVSGQKSANLPGKRDDVGKLQSDGNTVVKRTSQEDAIIDQTSPSETSESESVGSITGFSVRQKVAKIEQNSSQLQTRQESSVNVATSGLGRLGEVTVGETKSRVIPIKQESEKRLTTANQNQQPPVFKAVGTNIQPRNYDQTDAKQNPQNVPDSHEIVASEIEFHHRESGGQKKSLEFSNTNEAQDNPYNTVVVRRIDTSPKGNVTLNDPRAVIADGDNTSTKSDQPVPQPRVKPIPKPRSNSFKNPPILKSDARRQSETGLKEFSGKNSVTLFLSNKSDVIRPRTAQVPAQASAQVQTQFSAQIPVKSRHSWDPSWSPIVPDSTTVKEKDQSTLENLENTVHVNTATSLDSTKIGSADILRKHAFLEQREVVDESADKSPKPSSRTLNYPSSPRPVSLVEVSTRSKLSQTGSSLDFSKSPTTNEGDIFYSGDVSPQGEIVGWSQAETLSSVDTRLRRTQDDSTEAEIQRLHNNQEVEIRLEPETEKKQLKNNPEAEFQTPDNTPDTEIRHEIEKDIRQKPENNSETKILAESEPEFRQEPKYDSHTEVQREPRNKPDVESRTLREFGQIHRSKALPVVLGSGKASYLQRGDYAQVRPYVSVFNSYYNYRSLYQRRFGANYLKDVELLRRPMQVTSEVIQQSEGLLASHNLASNIPRRVDSQLDSNLGSNEMPRTDYSPSNISTPRIGSTDRVPSFEDKFSYVGPRFPPSPRHPSPDTHSLAQIHQFHNNSLVHVIEFGSRGSGQNDFRFGEHLLHHSASLGDSMSSNFESINNVADVPRVREDLPQPSNSDFIREVEQDEISSQASFQPGVSDETDVEHAREIPVTNDARLNEYVASMVAHEYGEMIKLFPAS